MAKRGLREAAAGGLFGAGKPQSNPASEEKPHYHGHRDRLRQRFLNGESDSLPDYELLELILFALPRRDTKKLAKDLLAQFGSLAEVISADADKLGSGLIDYSQKITVAAIQIADMKVWAHRS